MGWGACQNIKKTHPANPNPTRQSNPQFEFIFGGEGSAYWEFRLASAIAAEEGGGVAEAPPPPPPPPPPPSTDPLALPSPAGLIPELITAAATEGAPRHRPIGAAVAAAASARAAADPPDAYPPSALIQAKLKLLLTRLAAYAPGVTAADVCGSDVGRSGVGGGGGIGGGNHPPREPRFSRGRDRAGLGAHNAAPSSSGNDAALDAVFASWRSRRSADYHSGVAAFVAGKREAELGGG